MIINGSCRPKTMMGPVDAPGATGLRRTRARAEIVHRAAVRLAQLVSLADPPAPLALQ
jgi:hypothetical protein